MGYKSIKIRIRETDEHDVASTLAFLSHFPQGTTIKSRTTNKNGGARTLLVYHKENVGEEPDFLIRRLAADEYLIEFNERVKESDTGKIEEEINSDYTRS